MKRAEKHDLVHQPRPGSWAPGAAEREQEEAVVA